MPDLPANHRPDKDGKYIYVPAHPDGYGPEPPDPEEYAKDPGAFMDKYGLRPSPTEIEEATAEGVKVAHEEAVKQGLAEAEPAKPAKPAKGE